MNLSEKIRKYRKEKNMTQSELSKRIGISCRALQNYENGSRIPPLQVKLKLADIFNISIEELGINNIPGLYIFPKLDVNKVFPGIGELKDKKEPDPVEEFKFMATNELLSEEKGMILKLIEHYNYAYCNDRYDLSKIDDDIYMDLRNMIYISMKTVLKNYQK